MRTILHQIKSLSGVKENILFTWVEWIKDTEELRPPGKGQAEETGRFIDLGNVDLSNLQGLSLASTKGED